MVLQTDRQTDSQIDNLKYGETILEIHKGDKHRQTQTDTHIIYCVGFWLIEKQKSHIKRLGSRYKYISWLANFYILYNFILYLLFYILSLWYLKSAIVRNVASYKNISYKLQCFELESWDNTTYYAIHILYSEQLIYISPLSKLRKSAEISAVRYTNRNGIVCVSSSEIYHN